MRTDKNALYAGRGGLSLHLEAVKGTSIKTLLIYRLAPVFQGNFRLRLSGKKVIGFIESCYSILECAFFPYL
jgi:hypothetical protein